MEILIIIALLVITIVLVKFSLGDDYDPFKDEKTLVKDIVNQVKEDEKKEDFEKNLPLFIETIKTKIGEKPFHIFDKFFCEYTSTRLTFKKIEIDKLDEYGIIIINVVNENQNLTYQISKIDFISNFQNVINSKAYSEKRNYNYTVVPKHFEKYLVSDNSLLGKDLKLDDVYKIMDFKSLNSPLIKQILDETIREKKYPNSFLTKNNFIYDLYDLFYEGDELKEKLRLKQGFYELDIINLKQIIKEFESNNIALIGNMIFRDAINQRKFFLYFNDDKHYNSLAASMKKIDSKLEEKKELKIKSKNTEIIENYSLSKKTNDWEDFLLKTTKLKNNESQDLANIKFQMFFCDTNFEGEDGECFYAQEMQIKLLYKQDDEWYEDDTTYFPELVCGNDKDNDNEICLFDNTPDYDHPSLLNGWTSTEGMIFKEAVEFLNKMPVLDYNLLSDDDKEDFKYFSSSKMKSKF